MASDLQILALPKELLSLAADCIGNLGLFAAGMWLFPQECREMTSEDLERSRERLPEWIMLDRSPIDADERLVEHFVRFKRGAIIQIGRCDNDGLRLSQVSVLPPGRPSGWTKTMLDCARARTTSGVWGYSPITRASTFYKGIRFTPGAEAHAAKGGKLLAIAGNTQFLLQQPSK